MKFSPMSITPLEEWHLKLKFLPLFDMIVKGHKKPKDLIGDRQKTDIEGIRRTRNHRPTRKGKTRCYRHKEKNAKQRKMKCMKGYLDRSRRCRESIEKKPTSMDRESVEDLLTRQNVSWWIEKLSRSYRDKFQKAQWIEIVLTSVEKGRSKISMDREAVEKLSRQIPESLMDRDCANFCWEKKKEGLDRNICDYFM